MEYLQRDRFFKLIVVLGFVSFGLHHAWENMQCEPFFNHPKTNYMAADMLIAALMDVAVTYIVFAIISYSSGSWKWIIKPWTTKQWVIMSGTGLILSVSFELFAKVTNSWSYSELAPIVPVLEISLVPVIQFLILFPISFGITGYIIH